ncbi:uncharacterized protein [Musca autumnalis]|uniref:uncharacterized protein n=1 Tax=Musca autumnalis TaxID=221902 RepID=UPI003CE85FD4
MSRRLLLLIAIIAMLKLPSRANRAEQPFYKMDDNFNMQLENQKLNDRLRKFIYSYRPRSVIKDYDESQTSNTTTECVSPVPEEEEEPNYSEDNMGEITTAEVPPVDDYELSSPTTPQEAFGEQSTMNSIDQESKAKELRNLIQHLYIAQARVQLEAAEIKKAQAVANTAQQALEEAANHVRAITATLQNSQQEVAAAAIRAQTAQLQLAAHDQLLFAARQDVDALSSQMVGLQAAEGISQPQITVDVSDLLEKLNQPLAETDKPTPVPPIVPIPVKQKPKTRRNVGKRYQISQFGEVSAKN